MPNKRLLSPLRGWDGLSAALRLQVRPKAGLKRKNNHDLEVTVGIEAKAVISFGLEVNIEVKAKAAMEVIMKNLIVFTTCVWCGVAFLRAWRDTSNPSERSVIVNYLPDPGETRGGSIPPPRTKLVVAV